MATERDGDYSHGAYYDGMRINGVVSDLKIYFKDLRGSSLIAATKELFIVQECRPSQMVTLLVRINFCGSILHGDLLRGHH